MGVLIICVDIEKICMHLEREISSKYRSIGLLREFWKPFFICTLKTGSYIRSVEYNNTSVDDTRNAAAQYVKNILEVEPAVM